MSNMERVRGQNITNYYVPYKISDLLVTNSHGSSLINIQLLQQLGEIKAYEHTY